MHYDLEKRSSEWHDGLPGIVRAYLVDNGLTDAVIDRCGLGWDGDLVTVPVRDGAGRVAYVETWSPESLGSPTEDGKGVLLFGAEVLADGPDRAVIAEGVLEALVLQAAGFSAASATGSGRYFKAREWGPIFEPIPEVLVAFKNGPQAERRKWMLDRDEVIEKILARVPQARRVGWPDVVGRHGGAFEFFVQGRGTREQLEALWAGP